MPIDSNLYRRSSRNFTAALAAFGVGRLRFIGGQGQFSVSRTSDGWSLSETSKNGLLYVAERNCYREIEKIYPIERLTDLRSVLAQQYAGEHCAHIIFDAADHQRRVITFVYHKFLKSKLPRICILLPESFVLAAFFEGNHNKSVIQSNAGQWFLYVRGNRFSSQIAGTLCPDIERFSVIHGAPDTISQEYVSVTEKNALIINGLRKISPQLYWNFITTHTHNSKPFPWKSIGLVIFAGMLTYFSAVTLYLEYVQREAVQRLELISSETTLLVKKQQQQEQISTQLEAIQNLINQQQASNRLWSVVFYFIDNEVKISSLRWEEGQFTVQGGAPDADKLLQRVTEMPYVKQATFSEATRRERGMDSFSMAIVFVDEPNNVE